MIEPVRVMRISTPAVVVLSLAAGAVQAATGAVQAATGAAQAATGPVRFLSDSRPRGRGIYVQIDTNPTRITGRQESPSAITFLLPRGTQFDRQGVKQECSPAKARAALCPRVARVGFGHVVLHVAGYLFPGGQTDLVAYLSAFLSPPIHSGDPASLVIQVRFLGADQQIAIANHYFGTHIKPKYSVIGRIIPLRSTRYGLELAFSKMPGGIQVPAALRAAGVSATLTRFKLIIGRVRRVKVPVTRVISFGGTSITVHDHVLVAHHVLRRPASCPSSSEWPWQLRFTFPEGEQRVSGGVAC